MLAYKPRDLNYQGKSICRNCERHCIGSFSTAICDITEEEYLAHWLEVARFESQLKEEAKQYGIGLKLFSKEWFKYYFGMGI